MTKRKRWSEAEREALRHLVEEGYSHADIADALGRTLGAVEQAVRHRASKLGLRRR